MRISDCSSDVCSSDLATNHIAGIGCKTQSTGEERGGVVAYYVENACGVLTRGRLAQGASFEGLQEALDAARTTGGCKCCKNCQKRSAERRVRQECVCTLSSQWRPFN